MIALALAQIYRYTVNVKYSTHGSYIEYDILNLSMHNITSRLLKVYSL